MAKKKGDVSQKEAVRDALTALGEDAKPEPIQSWIREKYGMELERNVISVNKSAVLKAKREQGEGSMSTETSEEQVEAPPETPQMLFVPRSAAPIPAVTVPAATTPATAAPNSAADLVAVLMKVRALADEIGGTEKLKAVLDLMK